MANTTIQIKRSLSTSDPGTLQFGELAYSFQSGKTFIGDENGNSVVIGGNTYIQMLDAATASNINNTIVKRDSSGNFTATTVTAELSGNASTASRWQTARTLGFDGDVSGSSSIDGSTNANTTLSLNSINATSGTFGGTSEIPVFTVNEKGLITHSANVSVSVASTLNIDTDNGSNTVSLISDTLSLVGGEGISTSVTNNDTISFDVDNTVIRSTGNQSKTGNFTLVGDLNVTGNTIFQGNTSFIDIEHYRVSDPLIYLAANNYTSDIVSIGFAANYFDGTNELHTGLFRTPQSNTYYLFTGVTDELSANNYITPSANGFTRATLVADISEGIVSDLIEAIDETDGGTGLRSYATGDILYANNTNTLSTLSAASVGNVLISGSTPSWGKVGLTSHVSGVLSISNGGTNATTIGSAGSVAYSNGSSYIFNTAGSSGQALISGGTGAPSFGVADLRAGSLGFTSATANSVIYYSGTGNIMSYTNEPSDGNILQYSTASGVQFAHLDGGSF